MNKQKDDIENVTVGITIFNQDRSKIFLKKRKANELFAGKYGIPGGKVKFNESLETAIKRELYEETHININNILYIKSYKSENVYFFVYTAIMNENSDSFILLEDIDGLELAPNISDAIKDSYDFLEKHNDNLSINIVNFTNDIINKIADNIITINKDTGWDHFILQQRIGTIGTSIGLNILNNIEGYDLLKKKVYKTLIKSQLGDGGWGVKSSDNKFSITESTCNCAIAVFDYIKQENKNIEKVVEWLTDNMLNDFSWGCNKHSLQGRVTSTCIAIQTLSKISPNFMLENNINWLLTSQNKDGGWGFTLNSQSNLTATSMVITTLIKFLERNDNKILKGTQWIEKMIKQNIINEESEFEYIKNVRFEYKHSTIIYILRALIEQKGINNVSPIFLYENISSIIFQRNQNGFWEHSLTPNYFPIWHTYNILNLFLLLLKKEHILNLNHIQKRAFDNKIQIDMIKLLGNQFHSHQEENIIYY